MLTIVVLSGIAYFNQPVQAGYALLEQWVIGRKVTNTASSTDVSLFNNRINTYNYEFIGVGSSTSAVMNVGDSADTVDFLAIMNTASTTGSQVNFNFYESNDPGCDTTLASSTAGTLLVQTSDIRWFDLIPNNSVTPTTTSYVLQNASTTYSWTPGAIGRTTHLQFRDINTKCLKVEATSAVATSSIAVQMKTKLMFK